MRARVRERDGWLLVERGDERSRWRALLLPGVFCTHRFYESLVAEPALSDAGVLTLAADPPGFAGRAAPASFGFSVREYADLLEAVARAETVDLVVGHSYFANVAIEVAARGAHRGPLMLLSPCLRAANEERDLRQLDRLERVPAIGALAWLGVYPTLKGSMKGRLPADRLDELVSEMKRNPRHVNRQIIRRYFDHLGSAGGLAEQLERAEGPVWVVRGEEDEIDLEQEDRERLDQAPNVELKTIPDARHFSMLDAPSAVAALIVAQLRSAGSATS